MGGKRVEKGQERSAGSPRTGLHFASGRLHKWKQQEEQGVLNGQLLVSFQLCLRISLPGLLGLEQSHA